MENKPNPKVIEYDVDKEIIEGTERFLSTEDDPNLIAFEEEFAGAQEYGIATWFRWVEEKRVPWSALLSLTSNEEDVRTNNKLAGDRLLSIF